MEIYNQDVIGLVSRLDRFHEELFKSVSAGTSELNEFDLERTQKALAALTGYLDWIQAQPHLDLPESHPNPYPVPAAPAALPVESEIVNDILRIYSVLRIEMVNSQSSRKAANIIGFDEKRWRSLIAKLENYLKDYVAGYTPLDLPESSPKMPMSGPGRQGA